MGKKSAPKYTRAMMMLLPLANAFNRQGGDAEAILARHGIPLAALTDPTMLIDASVCYATMEDMAISLGDQYFGAKVAIQTAQKGSPGLRQAASQATTLGGFLARLVVEISTQVDNVRYLLSATSETARLEIQRTLSVSGPNPQLDAIGVAFYVSVIKLGLGKTFDPSRIIVTVPTTRGIPPSFLPKQSIIKSKINGLTISFPPQWLWAPFSLDWELADAPRGEFGLDGVRDASLSYFRSVLTDNIGHRDLSLGRFASICRLHPRHLQRLLAAQGTSYSHMRDEVRRSIAVDLLSNTIIPIANIAPQVGLSSSSALDRAFRQWTGKTPTRFRAESTTEKDAEELGLLGPG